MDENRPGDRYLLDSMGVDMDKILEFIPADKKDYVRGLLEGEYADIVTTNHPVVYKDGVLRWKADPLLRVLCDAELIDLNKIAHALYHGKISPDLYLDLNRRIGYSLSGFCEVVDSHPELLK